MKLLKTISHRPWAMPKGNWKFYQEWNNAVFLHWEVNLNELQKLVPKTLEIDLFEGKPWVSVVAFSMEKIRPKVLPAFPPISNFNEINVRTYVRCNDKTGVYFLSIEGSKKLSCKIAKEISGLPYRFSPIIRTEHTFNSNNLLFKDKLAIEFKVEKEPITKTALDIWLTERYALFNEGKNSIDEFEIHHLEWPINKIDFSKLEFNYPRFGTLIKGSPNLTHYSKGIQVLAWGKNTLGL